MHLYQPGLSLVAAGLKPASCTLSQTTDWLPDGITLVPENATVIDPVARTVATTGGKSLAHDFLIDDIASRGVGADKYEIHYAAPQRALFSVPIVHEKLRMLFEERGFNSYYGRVLKSIDPGTKRDLCRNQA